MRRVHSRIGRSSIDMECVVEKRRPLRVRQEVDTRSTEAGTQLQGTASAMRRTTEQLRQEGNEVPAKAMDFVAAANDPRKGWASGVMEDSRQSTKSWDVNTAAVLLEVAHYQLRGGKPLIEPGPVLP